MTDNKVTAQAMRDRAFNGHTSFDYRTGRMGDGSPDPGPPPRCPDWPQTGIALNKDIIGCGSTNVSGPDDEGYYTCHDCGIEFRLWQKQ